MKEDINYNSSNENFNKKFNDESYPYYINQNYFIYAFKILNRGKIGDSGSSKAILRNNISINHIYNNLTNGRDIYLENINHTFNSGTKDYLIYNLVINLTNEKEAEGNHYFNISVKDIFNNTHEDILKVIYDFTVPNGTVSISNSTYYSSGSKILTIENLTDE